MCDKRITGFTTLAVSILVLILSIACCIYASVELSPSQFKVSNTFQEFRGCLGAIGLKCQDGASFTCSVSNTNATTICGLNPSCFCIGNSSVSQLFFKGETSTFFNTVLKVVADLNMAAGILCIIGILPVVLGSIGAILEIDVLEKTCGIFAIIFEACFGVFSTLILCAVSYAFAAYFVLFGYFTKALDQDNHPQPHGHHNGSHPNGTIAHGLGSFNTCPSACRAPLTDLSNSLTKIGHACAISSNLAMAALGFSIIALICTCIGFCQRRREKEQDTALASAYNYGDSKVAYGALR